MMPDTRLKTERLVLRRMTIADAPALHMALSDAEAMRFWSGLPHGTLAETEAWVASTIGAVASGEADDFAVTLEDRVIGKAGLWRKAEVGILLAPAHWRRGYASEALGAIIDRVKTKKVPRIDADVDPRNRACLNMLLQLGFRQTGEAKATFRLGDDWADSVYFSLVIE